MDLPLLRKILLQGVVEEATELIEGMDGKQMVDIMAAYMGDPEASIIKSISEEKPPKKPARDGCSKHPETVMQYYMGERYCPVCEPHHPGEVCGRKEVHESEWERFSRTIGTKKGEGEREEKA